jgi:prefoldin alpha subunit
MEARPEAGSLEYREEVAELSYFQQLYQGQYDSVSRSINTAIQILGEMNGVKETLDKIDEVKGRNTLSPIGTGTYLHSKAENTDNVVVGVGAGYLVEKGIDDAKQFISKLIERQTNAINGMLRSKNEIEGALMDVSVRLERLAKEG